MDTAERRTTLTDFIVQAYKSVLVDGADERIDGWPLSDSVWTVVSISLVYIISVCWLAPYFMRRRKPMNLRRAMIAYNVIQIVYSGWMFLTCFRAGWFTGYSFRCQPSERAPSPRGLLMTKLIWWYYISKYVDFLDTVFIVLRKKYDQISFLHIFHHGVMPFGAWYFMKFLSGGHYTMVGFLNSFVHVVMYSYYLLAGMGPAIQKYLWWKKYLTVLQIVQFVLIFIHTEQLLFIDCPGVPKYPAYWSLLFAPSFIILFLNFYLRNYRAKGRKIRKEAAISDLNESKNHH